MNACKMLCGMPRESRPDPSAGVIDSQSVKATSTTGTRSYDARKRVSRLSTSVISARDLPVANIWDMTSRWSALRWRVVMGGTPFERCFDISIQISQRWLLDHLLACISGVTASIDNREKDQM